MAWYDDDTTLDLLCAGCDFKNDRYFIPALGSDITVGGTGYSLTKSGGKYPKQSATFAQWFAFTASSTAARTYTDNAGVIKNDLAADAPRLTYANGRRQLRLEDQRTNLALRSQDFANSAWVKNDLSAATLVAAPDGTLTGHRYTCLLSDASLSQVFTPSAAVNHTNSIWLRVPSGTWNLDIYLIRTASGVITSKTAALTTAWQRFDLTGSLPDTSTHQFQIGGGTTWANGVAVEVWGAQFEAGAFASDYIPTTTAAVTRAIETARLSPLLEAILQRSAASVVVRADLSNHTQNNKRFVGSESVTTLLYARRNAGNNQAATFNNPTELYATPGGSTSMDDPTGIAMGWDTSGRSVTGNGGTVASDANQPGARTKVYLARSEDYVSLEYGDGYYDFVGVSPERLTDTQLQALAVPAADKTFTATTIATSSPALGTPVLAGGSVNSLTATALATSSPALGSPALGQKHALTATGLAVSSPVLDTPALGQKHALTATALATSAPALGTPAMGASSQPLSASNLATAAPALGTPALGQVHVLTATPLATGQPILGTTQLNAPLSSYLQSRSKLAVALTA